MSRIIPIKDLRDTSNISKMCHEENEPVFVTKHGYSDLVIMSIDTYDKIVIIAQTDHAIASAEAEMAAGGEPIEAKEAFNELRRKHFEQV